MEVTSDAPLDALVPTGKRWQSVEGSSGSVLQRPMGTIAVIRSYRKLRPSTHGDHVGRLVQICNVGPPELNSWRH